MTAVKLLLTYNASEDDLEQIRAVSDGISTAAAGKIEEAIARAAEAEVIFAGRWSEELWRSASDLRWVQSWGAGIERFLTPDFVASPVMLTNARGVYAIPIADQVMAFLLHFSRGLNRLVRNQLERKWQHAPVDELAERTLGIVGIGGIGEEIARRAKAFDMRVVAVRRRPSLSSAYAEEVRGPDQLSWLLGESDYVALCSALTPQTRHLIGADELAQMKPTAYLINIGRGGLIDEAALAAALREGRVAGAGLDVFEKEPLPPESPLWEMENVLITPHNAGSSPRSHARTMELFCENLRRYLAREPLMNLVDKRAGY